MASKIRQLQTDITASGTGSGLTLSDVSGVANTLDTLLSGVLTTHFHSDIASVSGALYTQISSASGVVGPSGATGAQGPAGPSGAQGPQGEVGPSGATGPQGPAGPSGAQGPQGETGPAGPSGAIGPSGAQGPSGAAGSSTLWDTYYFTNVASEVAGSGMYKMQTGIPSGSGYYISLSKGGLAVNEVPPSGSQFLRFITPSGQTVQNLASGIYYMHSFLNCTASSNPMRVTPQLMELTSSGTYNYIGIGDASIANPTTGSGADIRYTSQFYSYLHLPSDYTFQAGGRLVVNILVYGPTATTAYSFAVGGVMMSHFGHK